MGALKALKDADTKEVIGGHSSGAGECPSCGGSNYANAEGTAHGYRFTFLKYADCGYEWDFVKIQ